MLFCSALQAAPCLAMLYQPPHTPPGPTNTPHTPPTHQHVLLVHTPALSTQAYTPLAPSVWREVALLVASLVQDTLQLSQSDRDALHSVLVLHHSLQGQPQEDREATLQTVHSLRPLLAGLAAAAAGCVVSGAWLAEQAGAARLAAQAAQLQQPARAASAQGAQPAAATGATSSTDSTTNTTTHAPNIAGHNTDTTPRQHTDPHTENQHYDTSNGPHGSPQKSETDNTLGDNSAVAAGGTSDSVVPLGAGPPPARAGYGESGAAHGFDVRTNPRGERAGNASYGQFVEDEVEVGCMTRKDLHACHV